MGLEKLLDFSVTGDKECVFESDNIDLAGFERSIRVCLRYYYTYLSGYGSFALDNLMEDASTTEISRV